MVNNKRTPEPFLERFIPSLLAAQHFKLRCFKCGKLGPKRPDCKSDTKEEKFEKLIDNHRSYSK